MNEYTDVLQRSALFKNVTEQEIKTFLACAKAKVKKYRKNEIIMLRGNTIDTIGVILDGTCHAIKEDYWGNKNIMGVIKESDIVGEVFAIQKMPLGNTVIAKTDVILLNISIKMILNPCDKSCSFHNEIIRNLISILAGKTATINSKLEHVTKRSMKDKVLSYLSSVSAQKNSKTFEIPFNRTELSEYLCVDRAALSKELSKLQKEGLISYKKNVFTLK
ncbi:MAG: Crp/Fnr family transcriptional regulator [Sphaerochaeta sp.]